MVDQTGNQTERALLDYLDGLLHDSDELTFEQSAPARATIAVSANVTQLVNARAVRPARLVEPLQTFTEPRPFAEPVRPLRMPLPPLADVATPTPVETKIIAAPATPEVAVPVKIAATIVVPETVVSVPAVSETILSETIDSETTPPAIIELAVEETALGAIPPAWAANGRPLWAQQAFECLLFKSGGLTLAVPLVELGSIYPLEEGDVTGIFGQIDWFLGLMHTKYGNVRVVDTARVVMPERYQEDMAAAYRFVLTLDGSDWGLAIDAIAGTALLDPDAVRWRSDRSKRPWLAGTVIEKMCALLDVAQMRHMFNQLDRKRGDRAPR